MKSIERLFPLIVIALGIVFFSFGFFGIIGGLIMIIGAMIYLFNNDRKLEFKVICSVLGLLILIIGIAFVSLSFNTSISATDVKIIKP